MALCYENESGREIAEYADCDALNLGKVYATGLDVVSTEPIRSDNPLLQAKNCIITPHISWALRESRARLMGFAVDNLRAFVEGEAMCSLQGTTQGNGLTGGVPPVRFSM